MAVFPNHQLQTHVTLYHFLLDNKSNPSNTELICHSFDMIQCYEKIIIHKNFDQNIIPSLSREKKNKNIYITYWIVRYAYFVCRTIAVWCVGSSRESDVCDITLLCSFPNAYVYRMYVCVRILNVNVDFVVVLFISFHFNFISCWNSNVNP